MKPYLTILLDSYRSLKSGSIFWITLGLSALVAVIFLSIGFDDKGISVFFGATGWENEMMAKDSPVAHITYVMIFSNIVAGVWLTFIAIILALISCSSIFPDAMEEGSAGMLMTKRPSRLGVFLAKLTGSLFFVLIQVGLFVLIVFIAFRWRLGIWNFSIFWYVPAVLLVFLNLYAFMVFIGVKTKSVMTSILLTMLLWGISAGLNWAIGGVSAQYEMSRYEMIETEPMVRAEVTEVAEENESANIQEEAESMPVTTRMERGEGDPNLKKWIDRLKMIHMPFPKNGPIMSEVEKKLVVDGVKGFGSSNGFDMEMESEEGKEAMDDMMKEFSGEDSWFYSVGSSFLFSLVMLGLAGWSFCRRDF